MKRLIGVIVLFSFIPVLSPGNEKPKNWSLNGYLTSMNSVIIVDTLKDYWITDYLLHNRLNFQWFPDNNFSIKLELRNRFMYGDQLKADISGDYLKSLDEDKGVADLSVNLFSGKSYVFNSMIDRAFIQYSKGKFDITAGRQRINWGQTFVWNPNDIFNTYSFFDFDYEERPGSDAIRLQYYPGMTSAAELAVKGDSAGNITAAGLFRVNKLGYDIQVLAGVLNSEDAVLGLGWSGNIKNVSFRGEMSYFHPYENFSDTSGLFFISAGLDYSFSNSLFLQIEALYSQMPKGFNITDFLEFYSGPLSVKNLSFTEFSLFAQAGYPLNPLVNVNLAGMYFPKLKGFYAGPSLSYSLAQNLDFSVYYQLFSGKFEADRKSFHLGFMRFKYSF
ncbi:MAG: hypothetical protein JXB00_09635 [Bacteroidales bacterium]|nr:hypothetical protein [Bacteroidales bacterium]